MPQSDVDAGEAVFLSDIMEREVVHQELQDFVADSKDVELLPSGGFKFGCSRV